MMPANGLPGIWSNVRQNFVKNRDSFAFDFKPLLIIRAAETRNLRPVRRLSWLGRGQLSLNPKMTESVPMANEPNNPQQGNPQQGGQNKPGQQQQGGQNKPGQQQGGQNKPGQGGQGTQKR